MCSTELAAILGHQLAGERATLEYLDQTPRAASDMLGNLISSLARNGASVTEAELAELASLVTAMRLETADPLQRLVVRKL